MQYIRHRVVRLPDTPHRIAAGIACGAAVSFTPFIGFHILLAIALAFVLRVNAVAAVIGTVIGNPWTFPFIWVLIYELGAMLMGLELSAPFAELIDVEASNPDRGMTLPRARGEAPPGEPSSRQEHRNSDRNPCLLALWHRGTLLSRL